MAGIKHSKVSAIADGDDETLVRPSDWNAEHVIEDSSVGDGKLATSYLKADGTRQAEEIRLNPKTSSDGPEGTMFYNSNDNSVYVRVE